MRRPIEDLRQFYGEPSGRLVRRLLAERLEAAWGEGNGNDILGLGYATPWLSAFVGARRLIAAMPSGQGVEAWPRGARNRSVLIDERALPFAAGSFDRVLMIHALEEAEDVRAMMAEAVRVLSPAGRIILVAAARGGLWARADSTPFGYGRPFTRRQLEGLVREVGLEPAAWSQTLYVPPWPALFGFADSLEQAGRHLMPGAAGLILLEATRQAYARVQPVGKARRVTDPEPGMAPVPARRNA